MTGRPEPLSRVVCSPGGTASTSPACHPSSSSTSASTIAKASTTTTGDPLHAHGWLPDEPWTPLHRDLTHAVEGCALRVETVGPSHVEERVAVQGAAFAGSTFTVDRWHTMTAGIPYQQARCLVGYDEGVAVAAVTVWSAGPGRPGLLEPMGVHRDHRGCGNGATAAALRAMGSSSAIVATPTSNKGAVATYAAAGFVDRFSRFAASRRHSARLS